MMEAERLIPRQQNDTVVARKLGDHYVYTTKRTRGGQFTYVVEETGNRQLSIVQQPPGNNRVAAVQLAQEKKATTEHDQQTILQSHPYMHGHYAGGQPTQSLTSPHSGIFAQLPVQQPLTVQGVPSRLVGPSVDHPSTIHHLQQLSRHRQLEPDINQSLTHTPILVPSTVTESSLQANQSHPSQFVSQFIQNDTSNFSNNHFSPDLKLSQDVNTIPLQTGSRVTHITGLFVQSSSKCDTHVSAAFGVHRPFSHVTLEIGPNMSAGAPPGNPHFIQLPTNPNNLHRRLYKNHLNSCNVQPALNSQYVNQLLQRPSCRPVGIPQYLIPVTVSSTTICEGHPQTQIQNVLQVTDPSRVSTHCGNTHSTRTVQPVMSEGESSFCPSAGSGAVPTCGELTESSQTVAARDESGGLSNMSSWMMDSDVMHIQNVDDDDYVYPVPTNNSPYPLSHTVLPRAGSKQSVTTSSTNSQILKPVSNNDSPSLLNSVDSEVMEGDVPSENGKPLHPVGIHDPHEGDLHSMGSPNEGALTGMGSPNLPNSTEMGLMTPPVTPVDKVMSSSSQSLTINTKSSCSSQDNTDAIVNASSPSRTLAAVSTTPSSLSYSADSIEASASTEKVHPDIAPHLNHPPPLLPISALLKDPSILLSTRKCTNVPSSLSNGLGGLGVGSASCSESKPQSSREVNVHYKPNQAGKITTNDTPAAISTTNSTIRPNATSVLCGKEPMILLDKGENIPIGKLLAFKDNTPLQCKDTLKFPISIPLRVLSGMQTPKHRRQEGGELDCIEQESLQQEKKALRSRFLCKSRRMLSLRDMEKRLLSKLAQEYPSQLHAPLMHIDNV